MRRRRRLLLPAVWAAASAPACLLGIDDTLVDRAHADGGAADVTTGDGGAASYRAAILAEQPIAYWRLGDKALPYATDERGANPGSYAGDVKLGVDGAIAGDPDTAASFDLSGTRVNVVGSAFDFEGVVPFTIEAWARPTGAANGAAPGYNCIASDDSFDDAGRRQGWLLWVYEKYGIGFERYYGGEKSDEVDYKPIPDGHAYVHLAAVYDEQAGKMTLYVDGAPAGELLTTRAIGHRPSAFNIGNSAHFPCSFLGDLDEVAIYDKPLDKDTIKRHRDLGTNGR